MDLRSRDLQMRVLPRRMPSRMRAMPSQDDLQKSLGADMRGKAGHLHAISPRMPRTLRSLHGLPSSAGVPHEDVPVHRLPDGSGMQDSDVQLHRLQDGAGVRDPRGVLQSLQDGLRKQNQSLQLHHLQDGS